MTGRALRERMEFLCGSLRGSDLVEANDFSHEAKRDQDRRDSSKGRSYKKGVFGFFLTGSWLGIFLDLR